MGCERRLSPNCSRPLPNRPKTNPCLTQTLTKLISKPTQTNSELTPNTSNWPQTHSKATKLTANRCQKHPWKGCPCTLHTVHRHPRTQCKCTLWRRVPCSYYTCATFMVHVDSPYAQCDRGVCAPRLTSCSGTMYHGRTHADVHHAMGPSTIQRHKVHSARAPSTLQNVNTIRCEFDTCATQIHLTPHD